MTDSPQSSFGSDFSSDGTAVTSTSSRSSSPGQLDNMNALGLTGCEHINESWKKCECDKQTRYRPNIPKMLPCNDDHRCHNFVDRRDQCPAKPWALLRSVNLPGTQNLCDSLPRKLTSFDIWLNSVLNDLYAPKDALIVKDQLLGMPQCPDEYQIHFINCLLPQELGMIFVSYRQTGVFPPKYERPCLYTS